LTATPIYRAEVEVTQVIEPNISGLQQLASQFGGLASLAGINVRSTTADPSFRAILRSRRLVEEFVLRNDVLTALYPEGPPEGGEPSLWLAVKDFREGILLINEDLPRSVITISMDWTDPEVAARWANEFVALANEILRKRAIDESTRNIAFLNQQVQHTNVVEVQRVMYDLIESETKTLMLANARSEFAFRVIDPAVPPEIRISPRRTVIVIACGMVGGFLGLVVILVRRALRGWHQR